MRPPLRGHVVPHRWGNLTPDGEFDLIQRPMRHRCHVRKFAQTVVRPPRQRSCHVRESVHAFFGRSVGRYVMYGNLSKPCLAAQSADMSCNDGDLSKPWLAAQPTDMLCTGICPRLARPPRLQRWRVRGIAQTWSDGPCGISVMYGHVSKPCFSTASAAEMSCTWICPSLVGRRVGRYVVYRNLPKPKPCSAAQTAEMSCN